MNPKRTKAAQEQDKSVSDVRQQTTETKTKIVRARKYSDV